MQRRFRQSFIDRSAVASSTYISKVSQPICVYHHIWWVSPLGCVCCLLSLQPVARCIMKNNKETATFIIKKKVACEINAEVSCCTWTPGCLSRRLCSWDLSSDTRKVRSDGRGITLMSLCAWERWWRSSGERMNDSKQICLTVGDSSTCVHLDLLDLPP